MHQREDRPFLPLLRRALRGRCPSCGKAPLFRRFLKAVEHCKNCGQRWDGHQADDFPAYLVILLLGHLIVPIVVEVNMMFSPPIHVQMLFWPALTAILALLMIQPAKGAVIAFQWSRRMHGFEKG
ncbi:DUF983 domain-containing protein [Rhizorhapis suberifaciens]|uniref:DUF983 domain-containing protein n=1 Tax=Rhizorhapis suberifaciens TaxID=13656 RepID=UPI00160E25D4|nr:DUF983 domain-containing protein [Rhizorhapis suberifaciens]